MLLTWDFSTALLYMCVHPDHRAKWTSLEVETWNTFVSEHTCIKT
jgi:hypothetical protein